MTERTLSVRDVVRNSPVDLVQLRFRRIVLALGLGLSVVAAAYLTYEIDRDTPVAYGSVTEHFKYGSIGSEPGGSLMSTVGGLLPPEPVFRVLPAICPEQAPNGYEDFGLLFEPNRNLPIGISQRHRIAIDQVGANCALCHTGTYRESEGSPRNIVLGMPANNLELQRLFRFVLSCTLDERFTPDNVVGRIEQEQGSMGFVQRLLYRLQVVPRVRAESVAVQGRVGAIINDDPQLRWGHGRVDTFNPYKATQFHWRLSALPPSELVGAADYPSLWNQKPREGLHLHWDGNNTSVDERNLSAALGAGVTPVTADHAAIKRVRDWIWDLKPPAYPFQIDSARAQAGGALYAVHCRSCHADNRFRDGVKQGGEKLGTVVDINNIQTDRSRLDAYTYVFAVNQYTLYPSSQYRFTKFRKTTGYANHPLDGIWLRAPYLHNGSVPNMRALLDSAEQRPRSFYKGNDVIDQLKLGFVSDRERVGNRKLETFDTTIAGNTNVGHEYATSLSAAEKDAIVEYMKTF